MPQEKQMAGPDSKPVGFWRESAGDLVSSLGSDSFFSLMSERLASAVSFDFLIIFLYRQDAAPAALHDSITVQQHLRGLRNYLQNSYVLNPFYQAVRRGVDPGVYLMKDFMPDAYSPDRQDENFKVSLDSLEEIGFLTDGWPSGMQELLIAMPLDSSSLIEISLSKKEVEGGFSEETLTELRELFPFLYALFRKHWQLAAHRLTPVFEAPLLEGLFQNFGENLLSEREREVVRLVLLGHSSTSIALNLDVALPTVKSHRRNAYAKLGISSQAELFAAFMATVRQRRV